MMDHAMNREPIANLLSRISLTILCCAIITSTMSQTRAAAADSSNQFIGNFESKKLEITIDRKDGKFRGELKRSGKSYSFTADLDGDSLRGKLTAGQLQSGFIARVSGDELTLLMGIDQHKLTRVVGAEEGHALSGRFAGAGLLIDLKKFKDVFRGKLTRRDQTFVIEARGGDKRLNGHILIGAEKSAFSIELVDKNNIKLMMGAQELSLSRLRGLRPMVRDNRTIRKQVDVFLAESKDMVVGSALASPDNRHVAFVAQHDSKRHVSLDGKEGKGYFRAGVLAFSPDSRRLSYVASVDGKRLVVIDGKEGPRFDGLGPELVRFSADSQRVGYTARDGAKWFAVIDGKSSEAFDAVSRITFSADGRRYGFVARRKSQWHVVIDGESSPAYAGVAGHVVFSRDGKRVGYVVAQGTKRQAVVDGKPSAPYDAVTDINFNSTGNRFCFMAEKGDLDLLVVDGVESKPYQRIFGAGFSPDGKQHVFAAQRDGRRFLVVDGKEQKAFEFVSPPLFKADGKFYFAAMKERRWGVYSPDSENVNQYDMVSALTMSPDGKQLAYATYLNGHWQAIVNNRTSQAFDEIMGARIEFSPDSRHFAFAAKNEGQFHIVINGEKGKPVGEPIRGSRITFSDNQSINTVVFKSNRFYRVAIELQ